MNLEKDGSTYPKILRFTHTIESNVQVDGPQLEQTVINVFETEKIRDEATQAFLAVISRYVKRNEGQLHVLGKM